MQKIIDFIRDFQPSNLNLGWGELVLYAGGLIVILVLINWMISFLPEHSGNLIRTIVKVALNVLSYSFISLIILNAILTDDYGNVFIMVVIVAAIKIDYWYRLYDKFVDRKMNKDS